MPWRDANLGADFQEFWLRDDILTAHLIRNESGKPDHRKHTLIDGTWMDGTTMQDLPYSVSFSARQQKALP